MSTEEPKEPASQPAGSPPPNGALPAESAAPATPAAPAEPQKPVDRRDILRNAFANPTPRLPDGRFAPKAPAPAAPAQAAAPVVQRAPMPKSLKKELESHWNTAPVELANAVHQREIDYERGVEPLKSAKKELDEILKEFEPYQHLLKAEGSTPRQAIAPLLQTAAILRTGSPQQKALAIAQIVRQYAVPMEHVSQLLQAGPQQWAQFSGPPTQPVDPHYQQLAKQVEELKQLNEQKENARVLALIQEFAANPEHIHFEAVQERMLALLNAPAILGPDFEVATEQGKLKLAYDAAIRMDPAIYQIYQRVIAAPQSTQTAAQQVIKAKNAAVQVKGAPAPGPTPKINPKDRRQLLTSLIRANR